MDSKTIELLLGFSELLVTKVVVNSSRLDIDAESRFSESVCPSCLKKCNQVHSVTECTVRDRNMLDKEVYLHLKSRQFYCEDCHRYFQEQFSFVAKHKNMTLRLEQYLYLCLKDSSTKEVAIRENVLWDVLQNIFDTYSKKEIAQHLQYSPKRLGIDEFSYRKGKKDYVEFFVSD